MQSSLFPVHRPDGQILASYGGGVNSVAAMIFLKNEGIMPRAILMADPGDEWDETEVYRDQIMRPWLRQVGFPDIQVITRKDEGQYRDGAWRLETLREESLRSRTLPSIAYGWKKCSLKYKAQTQHWWTARQEWAQDEWRAERRIVRLIGYDAGEMQRVKASFLDPDEAAKYVPWYPLVDAGLDRDDCKALILSSGLPLPPKSACTFCPNNTLAEWQRLRAEHPDRFADAVEISRTAATTITDPAVVGLMRCNPQGQRQLHTWADGGYDTGFRDPVRCAVFDEQASLDAMPCECGQ